jgi:DNA-binding NarL/FixJ family response regulator
MSAITAATENAATARLTLVGAASARSADSAIDPVVMIDAPDPILALGIRAQLELSGVQVTTGDDPAATVVIAVTEELDHLTVNRLRRLNAARGVAVVLVVSQLDSSTTAAVVDIGACVVVMRCEATTAGLARAVEIAGRGEVALPPALMRQLLDFARNRVLDPPTSRPTCLSERERQVLTLVAEGRATVEVARHLCYSERTIKNVLQDLSTRLQLRNRTHVVAHAIRNGWI